MAQPLTPKEEAFCVHFAKHRRGPAAYVAAYEVQPTTTAATIASEASRLLALPKLIERIAELQEAATAASPDTMTVAEVFGRFVQIATADPNELIEVKRGACRYCHGEGHGYQWREREYLEALTLAERAKEPLPDVAGGFGYQHFAAPAGDCPECGGDGIPRTLLKPTGNLSPGGRALYGGAKETRNGIELIIADRMKALELVGRILGVFNDKLVHGGAVGLMANVVTTASTDPHEAARMYEEMVKGKLVAGK